MGIVGSSCQGDGGDRISGIPGLPVKHIETQSQDRAGGKRQKRQSRYTGHGRELGTIQTSDQEKSMEGNTARLNGAYFTIRKQA